MSSAAKVIANAANKNTKSAPQLNLFSFGFPMTLIGAFLILYFSVDAIAFAFKDLLLEIIDLLMSLLVELDDG